MLRSRVNTEYSIHGILDTASTVYTEYCIHRLLHTPFTVSSQDQLSPAPRQCLISRQTMSTQLSTFLQLPVNQWIESQLPSCLPLELPPPHWPPPSTPPISLDHGLQVHLQPSLITASKGISKLTQLLPLSPYLQTPSMTVSNCISKHARLLPATESPNSHDHSVQVHL